MHRYILYFLIIINFTLLCNHVDGQNISLYRNKSLIITSDTTVIDTLSIVFNSVQIKDKFQKIIDNNLYSVDYNESKLIWLNKTYPDTISITYTLLNFNFNKTFYNKNYSVLSKTDSIMKSGFYYSIPTNNNNIFDLGAVKYDGSFARGISFGNNQDVVVNSVFNLQMQGLLPGNIQLNAALTDNNIPIQPEGNTQQLQEFDRVFIQFKKNKNSLTVGDFTLQRPQGYFLNYLKNLQGFSYEGEYNVSKKWKGYTKSSVAVAKGKYARNIFNAIEGNQGPYRLTGANGETFIIILSGSEKVYIDGVRQQRGADADYIIDYNSGEITFTTKRLISSDLRLQVEFEYSDRNYFRSLAAGTQELTNDKLKLRLNFYSEQDSKNQPVQQDLDSLRRNILNSVGDSIQYAFLPSIDSVGFESNKVLYKKILDPIYGYYYVYSTNSDSAIYSLQFSYVGNNKGNYSIAKTATNGRVYRWIAPIGGQLQGNYEPYILIVAPQQRQMLTSSFDYKPSLKSSVSVETAISNRDINTFSQKNNSDNVGVATYLNASHKIKLESVEKNPLELILSTRYEFNDKNFNPIENYRVLEFDRDWNTSNIKTAAVFHNAFADIKLRKSSLFNLQYQFGTLNRGIAYKAYQQQLNFDFSKNRLLILSQNSYTSSITPQSNISFLRPFSKISYIINKKKNIQAGLSYRLEENKIKSIIEDTLQFNSFRWQQTDAFIKNSDTVNFNYSINYIRRIDEVASKNIFKGSSYSDNFSLSNNIKFKPNHILGFTITYRKLNIIDTSISILKPDESLVGRADYNYIIKNGFATITSVYQIGSGLEQRLEFTYVQVPAGQGIFAYIADYNNNGVKDLNEFEISPFPDQAEYIKVFIPTNDYIKVFTNQFSGVLSIQPRVLWQRSKGLKKFISRFGNTTSLTLDNKLQNIKLLEASNPFQFNVSSSILVTNNSLVGNTLSFNRISSFYSVDYNYQRNTNKSLLTNGFESRFLEQHSVKLRWNINKRWSYFQDIRIKERNNLSEFFENRNFSVQSKSIEPKIVYQSKSSSRISFSYFIEEAINNYQESDDKYTNNKLSAEFRVGKVSKSLLNVKLSYAKIIFTGVSNSPLQFALLEGLSTGDNIIWNITYDKRLSKVLELSFNYDGRKTGNAKTIHVGRAQIRAIF